jgi:2-C-methyl-D-erythritol 2,4-cyclodiphosphate synthase
MNMRVGQGFDVHRFERNRPLMLGCVHVESSSGLAGHSDADVVAHAIADALLGAAALGDLGTEFPSTAEWRDAPGARLLQVAAERVRGAGWDIANVDATIVAEEPRIGPYREAMQAAVASALGLEAGAVSVKATTTDGLGFTGRGEGIACYAVALLSGG